MTSPSERPGRGRRRTPQAARGRRPPDRRGRARRADRPPSGEGGRHLDDGGLHPLRRDARAGQGDRRRGLHPARRAPGQGPPHRRPARRPARLSPWPTATTRWQNPHLYAVMFGATSLKGFTLAAQRHGDRAEQLRHPDRLRRPGHGGRPAPPRRPGPRRRADVDRDARLRDARARRPAPAPGQPGRGRAEAPARHPRRRPLPRDARLEHDDAGRSLSTRSNARSHAHRPADRSGPLRLDAVDPAPSYGEGWQA